ncbi:MAG: TCP-1/cpn60 chaperonin family protein, partial [Nitrospinota bacterium]|nr:TCP-1/cpn60 chaperonin family protein [Nitrospinota bacterium]
ADNGGYDGAVILHDVEAARGAVGFNAASGVQEDLAKAGVIDPVKVTRSALQNAASLAGVLLTTELLITERPEEEEEEAAGHSHGGHGHSHGF